MKRLLITLVFSATIINSFSQDPSLIDDWFLIYTQGDLGDPQSVFDVEPPISPYIIINQDLTFEGFGACNSFEGNFSYDAGNNYLVLDSFNHTNEQCAFNSHIDFENNFFSYFLVNEPYEYYISISGELYFVFTTIAGFEMVYDPEPLLSNADFINMEIDLFPNPTQDFINISFEAMYVESIYVRSMSGQELITLGENSTNVDVSSLSNGLYLLEINTEKGRLVKKFIKE